MRARRDPAAVMALLLAGLVAGCLGEEAACPEADLAVLTPLVAAEHMQTDPAQAWQTVVLAPGNGSRVAGNGTIDAMALEYTAWPQGWDAHGRTLSPAGEGPVFQAVTVSAKAGSAGGLDLAYGFAVADGRCRSGPGGTLAWSLAEPEPGAAAQPGQGVHVMTAGFFENGTLFYTNIHELDGDARWPRIDWYAWEGGEPLPVYVYDEARTEQPAHWTDPQAGTPLAGTVPGVGYFTTIPGFNDALHGLSTRTTRVVHLTPEEGYTRPGNEEHPLYGHPLVFYIKVLDVVDVPCPAFAAEAVPCSVQQVAETGRTLA